MSIGVVMATYNRSDVVRRAVDSVLAQTGADLELIVVDDGSTDRTLEVLASSNDPRLRVIGRTNGGLSAARNTGIAAIESDWVTFLDDDDIALPGWLGGFAALCQPDTGLIFCGVEYRAPGGNTLFTVRPAALGPLLGDVEGVVVAGAWAIRTDVMNEVGGFDELMTCSHQTEALVRLIPAARNRGLRIIKRDEVGVAIEQREPDARPMSSPTALYTGTSRMLQKHSIHFGADPSAAKATYSVLGVSAARIGRWPEARAALRRAAWISPKDYRGWLRFAAALVPPLGRRVWKTKND